jgi:hypothetical protein
MFPWITRSWNLNSAIIEWLKKSSETYLNTQYANILWTGVYQRLQQDYNKLTWWNYSFYNVSSWLQNYLNWSDTWNYDEEFINSLNNSNNVETALTWVWNYLNSYWY